MLFKDRQHKLPKAVADFYNTPPAVEYVWIHCHIGITMNRKSIQRFLTGMQSTGWPHLGNVLSAMLPVIDQMQSSREVFVCIADLHTLTTIKSAQERKRNAEVAAAAWLALGLDPGRVVLYRQSQVPLVCELLWYLSCLTPYPMLANAHSFKDKSNRLAEVSAGLFTYPVLMAADILLYRAEVVPVGKDQSQHLEIARDLAGRFNRMYGTDFPLPEAYIEEKVCTVPGTDGEKMSKSYHNTIDVFASKATVRRQVMRITTDSLPLAAPKNPDCCTVFSLYKLLASSSQADEMRSKYNAGNFGYGQSKQALLELILDRFGTARAHFETWMSRPDRLDALLTEGEARARAVAEPVMHDLRGRLGY